MIVLSVVLSILAFSSWQNLPTGTGRPRITVSPTAKGTFPAAAGALAADPTTSADDAAADDAAAAADDAALAFFAAVMRSLRATTQSGALKGNILLSGPFNALRFSSGMFRSPLIHRIHVGTPEATLALLQPMSEWDQASSKNGYGSIAHM